jgi:hypothetical protein
VARTTFRLPGTDGPDISVERAPMRRARVFVGDAEIEHAAASKDDYAVTLPDGTARTFRLTNSWQGLAAIADDGSRLPLERPLGRLEYVIALLPIALVAVGGLVGGIFGGVGAAVNLGIARSGLPAVARTVAMLGVAVVAAVAWFGVASFIGTRIGEIPQVATGECLRDVGPNQQLTVDNARPVDCAGEHDGEVVGTTDVDGAAGIAFPGQDAIEAAATADCLPLFASYVGVSFDTSRLDMYYIGPTPETWARDDRTIACIAIGPGATSLTGSVRGTAQ